MRFNRQLLFLAYLFANERAHGLVIRQHDIASIKTSSTNLVRHVAEFIEASVVPPIDLSLDGRVLRDSGRGARIKRERALFDRADSTPTTSPGLVVPAFQLPSKPGAPATVVAISATPSPSPTMTSQNALSVFISALPSSVHSSLASEGSSLVSEFFASSSSIPSSQSSSISISSAPSSTSTSSLSRTATSQSTTSHSPATIHTSTTSSTTFSTTSSSAPVHPTAAHQPNSTLGADPSHPIPQAEIAGIVSGIGAAAVIGVLAVFYIWRRQRQGNPLFGPRGSHRSGASEGVYPRSAWLYDPVITPHQGRSRQASEAGSEAEQNLLPNPVRDSRPLSEDIEADLGMPSPSLRTNRGSSPLLPVQEIPAIMISEDDHGPYGSSPYGSPYQGGEGRKSRYDDV